MNQAKILVVEDEPVVGHDLRSRLEAMGHTVTAVVVSGEEALLEAEKGRPDLVLLDIAIKGTLTGPEAAEAIRTRLGIPVVFVAGHADPERLDRVRPTTPLGCLLEPFTDREIEMAVDMARYVSWIVSDRQRAEEALQESERRYRLLVETAAEGIAVAQGDRLVFVNDMAEHISGWTKDALLSRPFLEFVHPEDRDGVARRHLARLKGETLPRRNRYRLLRPDGSTTWVEANGVLIDWEGQPASLNLFTDITDRVSDEQALRESQSRYHQLFANMKSGVVIFAAQDNGDRFVITDVNQAGERIGNFDKDEVIGRSVPEVFPGIETWGLLEVFRRVWRTGAPERLPVSRYMDDRLDLWVENYIYRLPSGELVAVYDDVTERARAEAALRASRREWEQIFEAIGHPTLILDPEHGLVNANRAALEAAGRTREELLGRKCYEIFHGAEGPPQGCPLESLMDSGSSDTVEMEMEALGRFFLVRCTPMHDEDGRVVRVIHIATDITERRQAEEALRDSEERSRALLNAFPDIAVLVDTDFRYLAANEPAAEALGMRPRDMLGRRVEDLLPAGAGAGRAARGREVLRTGEPVEFEDEMFGRNFVNSAYPVFDDKGEVSGLAVFCQDITERRRLEEQLRQSQKMEAIGQLAAGIAHEFNNLMAVVINYSDLAGEGLRPGDPALDDLRHIKIAGERAATLTKQILTFSRRQIIAPRVLDLNRIVLGQERMLRRVVGENVELVTRLDPDLGGVKADPGQLEQVLINLALNARDAMPQGGRLVMSTSNVDLDEGVINHDLDAELTPGRYVRLSVEDTGTGIDPEILPKIFDPFFTTKDRATHNGLGLSTVYGMVTQAGGGLKVENEPGRGATFHLYLPPSDEPVDRSEDAPPPAWPLETILVVEDEPMVRKMIRRVLETTGYRVLSAANGQEALASAERHGREIHLLLTDVVMPGESGPRVAARLKTGHPGLKVIYVSGYPEDIVVRHGVFPGEVHLISKPFSPEDLVRKIRRVLDKTG